jgi:hypothetical protein
MLRFEFSRRAIRIDQSERSLRENSGAPVRARSPVGTLNLRLETGRPAAHNAIMPEGLALLRLCQTRPRSPRPLSLATPREQRLRIQFERAAFDSFASSIRVVANAVMWTQLYSRCLHTEMHWVAPRHSPGPH